MMSRFAFDPVVTGLVALAAVAGMLLALRHAGRWRVALVALQPLAAALLLAALSLQDAPSPATLLVLTPDADRAALDTLQDVKRIRLPGAPADERAEAVPDLATALRRHSADRIIVAGGGLARHDRDAIGARTVEFIAAAPAPGAAVVELDAPATVQAGTWWKLRGRAREAEGTRLVLLDPAGTEIMSAVPGNDGRFALEALARAPGPALFELQLRIDERTVQSLPVPVVGTSAAPLRVLVLAASPSPELKYLRRWALDAGARLETRIALAPGLAQRRGNATLDAATLAELDLLVVDERSWTQLAALQPALREAVAAGLGLMVRITGPVPDRIAQEWKTWGIDGPFAAQPAAVRLPGEPKAVLHAWGTLPASSHAALVATADGNAPGHWVASGRGRVGTWRLADTHRLYTRGERERHAMLWSEAWATLARPRGTALPQLRGRAVAGERAILCGVADGAAVASPAGTQEPLATMGECAAYWPRSAGWHRLQPDDALPFYVHDATLLGPLLAEERLVATQALVRGQSSLRAVEPAVDRDLVRAALLLAWLAIMALAWWLERRIGARPPG